MQPTAPPFSPLLMLGMALRPVPPSVACRVLRPLVRKAEKRLAPLVRDRLSGLSGTVAVVPSDFPYGVLFCIADGVLTLDPILDEEAVVADARVRAPAMVLLDLARAQERDGDASFFSRVLVMEGDTGLVMALRYALEDAGLDPVAAIAEDLPLPASLRARLPGDLDLVLRRANQDARRIQDAILAPLAGWRLRADSRLSEVERHLAEVERTVRRRSRPSSAASHAVEASHVVES